MMTYSKKMLVCTLSMSVSVLVTLFIVGQVFGWNTSLADHHGLPGIIPLSVVLMWVVIFSLVTRKK